jgi:hypothetical protein
MERINRLIQPEFAERLKQFDELTTEIADFLSLPLENRLWPILKNHRLTLLTDDPHLATQARFQQHTLCKHLSKRLNLKISGLNIKVIGLPFASNVQKYNRKKLSNNTAQIVHNIALGINDQELQSALHRLADAASHTQQSF